mmetsp:Transcript_1185/g.1369  ORF Transcript_1185/g.1369 Transcript_1185/m.1369 type:complete len:85 (-) Transcript_1185:124-378(-)
MYKNRPEGKSGLHDWRKWSKLCLRHPHGFIFYDTRVLDAFYERHLEESGQTKESCRRCCKAPPKAAPRLMLFTTIMDDVSLSLR